MTPGQIGVPCADASLQALLRRLGQPRGDRRDGRADAADWPAGVIWITGLSGVGKTALAAQLVARLAADGADVAWLDGDAWRRHAGAGRQSDGPAAAPGYGAGKRRQLAFEYVRLAAEAATRGCVAVVSTISLLHDVQAANRRVPHRYLEVWLRAAEPLRRQRAGDRSATSARVGVELAAEFPLAADLMLDNDDRPCTLPRLAQRVAAAYRA